MNLYIVIGILFLHWIFDFVFQTEWQAMNKSKDREALLQHTAVYAGCWLAVTILYAGILDLSGRWLLFPIITFFCHSATDYYTSRVNAILWEKKDTHGFFVSVGFDQFLHYVQLFVTFKLLS